MSKTQAVLAEVLKWRTKRDQHRNPIPGCWETRCGYTVALCRLPEHRYTVTAPDGRLPFAYTGAAEDVPRLIEAHKASLEVEP
ncbi:hypothetical protein HNP29_004351 [Pseudomonas alcaligenes]|nr:hypothetical protein [Pseudomonas alcaligenes]